jgi:uncharacterized protein YfaP (DUF2135 family)
VPTGRNNVKVTLDWSGGADLDLHVWAPNGKKYGYSEEIPPAYFFTARPEVINLPSPVSGSWQLRVYGYSGVPSGGQSFNVKVEIQ